MRRRYIYTGIAVLALFPALLALAEEQKAAQPEVKAGEPQAVEKNLANKSAADPYIVPDGDPKQLVEFIDNLLNQIPPDRSSLEKGRAAMLKAADKILAAKPTERELDLAVGIKMNLLTNPADVSAFAEELKKAGRLKQSRMVHGFILDKNLQNALINGKTDLKKEIDQVLKFLRESQPQFSDLELAFSISQAAEKQNNQAYLIEVYRELSKIFESSKDARLANFGKKFEGAVRRLTLPGKQMQLEGKLLSGEKLDFAKYLGKVVLVDFWASWCGPCRAQMPLIKKLYETYHDKGFEIIGFSCDRSREDLEKFLQEAHIPWAIVYGDKGPSPTVDYYGVFRMPTTVLLGKDGKVIELDLRADELESQLKKLLGPPNDKKSLGNKLP
ncbi:MAG: TlpA family protein disulfide reductase [Thermoguttaceae bacterium]